MQLECFYDAACNNVCMYIFFYNFQSDGFRHRPFKLHYFDHLLQEDMTGIAVCENSLMSLRAASPMVTCRTTQVTVKLPRATKLRKVKELGKD